MKKNYLFILIFIWGFSQSQVGIGNTDPKVQLDIRGAGNSAIAFGNTIQTAVAAAAGAIKYDPLTKKIFYSDGVNWVELAGSQPAVFVPKVVASGRTTTSPIVYGGGIFRPWEFTDIRADDGNWNNTNRTYTVPTSGFYQLSLAGGVLSSDSNNGTQWQVRITDTSNNLQAYALSYQANWQAGNYAYQGGTIVLYINAGSVIRFGSLHCSGCASPPETYRISEGATFSIAFLGS